jgi:hypothetical protein
MRGIIEREIDGKVRHFHFGTKMFLLCEDQGLTLGNFKERMQERMFGTTVDMGYNAAVAYCKLNKEEQDFTKDDVCAWVDEVGATEFINMITEGLKVLEKNQEAPA